MVQVLHMAGGFEMTLDGSWIVLLSLAAIQVALLITLSSMERRMIVCSARIGPAHWGRKYR
jgi:hypothetical protein